MHRPSCAARPPTSHRHFSAAPPPVSHLIDGRRFADELLASLALRVQRLRSVAGRAPCVAVVQVGAHPESELYIAAKRRAAERVGAEFLHRRLSESCSSAALLSAIQECNNDHRVDGVIVQLPLPRSFNAEAALRVISPEKDVDGFSPLNVASLASTGRALYTPCTSRALLALLDGCKVRISGANAVVVGKGRVVGLPTALMLLHRQASVSIAHRQTSPADLERLIRHADIVVAAAGCPGLVRGEWIKPGATVLDVGLTRLTEDGPLQGDVQYHEAAKRAAWITPVPGGVGPMTVAMLLQATIESLERRAPTPS